MKKIHKFFLVIIGMFVLVLSIKLLYNKCEYTRGNIIYNDVITECEALNPHDWPLGDRNKFPESTFEVEVKLDLSKKEELVKRKIFSNGKYGFRKKLVVEKETILEQKIWEDWEYQNIFYGIYNDELLEYPVEELSIKDLVNANKDLEMGADIEDYTDYKSLLVTALQPGIYYVAVYTTKPTDDFTLRYESWQGTINDTDLSLDDGKSGYFFAASDEQKTYFKIDVPGKGILQLSRHFSNFNYKAWLCDENKNIITKAELEPESSKKPYRNATVDVPGGGKYYLMVMTDCGRTECVAWDIRYKFKPNH